MQLEELCRRLAPFGLDEAEARLYYHLSRAGPSRASDLAEQAGVHRTEVYRIAGALADKGFAERTLERPVRFVPLPLADIIRLRADAARKEVDAMKDAGDELVQAWPSRARSWGSGSSRFSVHQGLPQIRSLIGRMVEHAQEEVVVVCSQAGLNKLGSAQLMTALARQVRAGVQVRILTKIDAANVAEFRSIAAVCDVRHVELSGYHQMFIIDSQEIALFVSSGRQRSTTAQEETVMWLNAPDFVLAQKALVDRTWPTGVRHGDMSEALSRHAPPPRTEALRGRLVLLSLATQLLYHGRSVLAHVPARAWPDWEERGLVEAVASRRDQGADIRVSVGGVHDALPDGIGAASDDLPFTVLATGEGEALVIRHGTGEPGARDDWGLHCTLPDVGVWAWNLLAARIGDPGVRMRGGSAHAAVGPFAGPGHEAAEWLGF